MRSGQLDTRIQIWRKGALERDGRSRIHGEDQLVADCLCALETAPMNMRMAADQNVPSGLITLRITREPDVEAVDQNCIIVMMDLDQPGDRYAVQSCQPHPKDQRHSLQIIAAGDGQ